MDWKKEAEKLREMAIEHKRRLETDAEYRRQCEEIDQRMDKFLPNFGNDTKE